MNRADRTRQTAMLSVFDGRRCVGHILSRGKQGYEAFDGDHRSLGVFDTQAAAAAAIPVRP
jgi:hypothetical protein